MADAREDIVTLLEQTLIDAREGRFSAIAIAGINREREHLVAWSFDDADPRERERLVGCAQKMTEELFLGDGPRLDQEEGDRG